jgi:hypothetical protein
MTLVNKYWFKRKLFGWGWTPATWQGYLATLLYLLIMIGLSVFIDEESASKDVIVIFFLTLVFIYLAYKKGEPPRWQWGRKKK